MQSMPAREFLDHYTSAYGAPWAEVFYDLTGGNDPDKESLCAKHMAEFIDDLEMYGQQEPVYVDKEGMVSEGNRIAMALAVLGDEINYVVGEAPDFEPQQVWEVEFEVLSGDIEECFEHLEDIFSFRFEDDWVYPLTAGASMETKEISVVLFCRSGEYTADRLAPTISQRLEHLAKVVVTGLRVSAVEAVDEDSPEC